VIPSPIFSLGTSGFVDSSASWILFFPCSKKSFAKISEFVATAACFDFSTSALKSFKNSGMDLLIASSDFDLDFFANSKTFFSSLLG
jgi:hypothetical protein